MRVISIEIKNVGIVEDVKLTLDKPLMLFYGDLKQGKSTILKAFKWAVGGGFPSDILRHGTQEGHIIIGLQNGSITRSFYVGRDQTTKAQEIIFIKDGRQVLKPAAEIQALLNPFITDPEYLLKLEPLARKKYFVEMFSINTDALDKENTQLENDAKELRATIRGYGNIDATPIEPVNLDVLKSELAALKLRNQGRQTAYQAEVDAMTKHNGEVQNAQRVHTSSRADVERLKGELALAEIRFKTADDFLTANQIKGRPVDAQLETDTDIQSKIEEGAAQNVRAEQAASNKKRLEEKQGKELLLSQKEARQRTIRDEKIALLAKLSQEAGVVGLVFSEDGEFTFEGIQSGMLSTSQMVKLGAGISDLYPEGLNVTLLDRAECLGKSIFEYVEAAKREDKTILAAIVGERPATVPADVGVFVVENGRVS